jgi:hypothetical protein
VKKSEFAAKQTHSYQLLEFMSSNFQRGSTLDMFEYYSGGDGALDTRKSLTSDKAAL